MNLDSLTDRALGCLLAGAVGDALGAPVEFMDREAILARFGKGGIRDHAPGYGGVGLVTDDTQMTLFTAEGLLAPLAQGRRAQAVLDVEAMRGAYLRWLHTQALPSEHPVVMGGWLLAQPELFYRRAPGNTCLSALRRRGGERNHSKGCGGVMRIAPCAIVHAGQLEAAFDAAVEAAKLTHGHVTGYLASGVFAAILASLMTGQALDASIGAARALLLTHAGHEETLHALDQACRAAAGARPVPEAIAELGEGWVAEEALAIAVYCALTAATLEEGVVNAVNITGDSDSTGAMAGQLLGALHGAAAIPPRWLAPLELRAVIETVARDLVMAVHGPGDAEPHWQARYLLADE